MKVQMEDVLRRSGDYFMGQSPVHRAAERIARTLTEMQVPFAIAGALALNAHGYLRATEGLDLLMTAEGLAAFKQLWLGRGWGEKFPGSRGMRDVVEDVKINVLLTGEFPGDGKPKPVAFPDPAKAREVSMTGLPVITLPVLLELKLASGMTAADRIMDLDDAIRLIKINKLPRSFASNLNEYVRAKFDELWPLAQIEDDY